MNTIAPNEIVPAILHLQVSGSMDYRNIDGYIAASGLGFYVRPNKVGSIVHVIVKNHVIVGRVKYRENAEKIVLNPDSLKEVCVADAKRYAKDALGCDDDKLSTILCAFLIALGNKRPPMSDRSRSAKYVDFVDVMNGGQQGYKLFVGGNGALRRGLTASDSISLRSGNDALIYLWLRLIEHTI